MKQCLHCGLEKAHNKFSYLKGTTDGYNGYCTDCFEALCELDKHRNPGWVYAIEGAGKVKIGVTTDLAQRLKNHQTGSPVPLRLVAAFFSYEPYEVEAALHATFKKWHSHLEWFDYRPIKSYLLSLLRTHH
jgi:predicted GIY-YIG superfamily endonuclease